MSELLACLCCCCFETENTSPPQRSRSHKKKKKTVTTRVSRLRTKYKKEQIFQVSDEDRYEKRVKAYCCPICTLYFTRILACSECINFICLKCFEDYDNKIHQKKEKMKCPFCSSEKSFFCDYQLDPHSYFDTTNKGFISKQDKIKMEEEQKENNREENVQEIEQENDERER